MPTLCYGGGRKERERDGVEKEKVFCGEDMPTYLSHTMSWQQNIKILFDIMNPKMSLLSDRKK